MQAGEGGGQEFISGRAEMRFTFYIQVELPSSWLGVEELKTRTWESLSKSFFAMESREMELWLTGEA